MKYLYWLLIIFLSITCLSFHKKVLFYKKWKDECVMRQMPPSLMEAFK